MDKRRSVIVIGATMILLVGGLLGWILSGSTVETRNLNWVNDRALLSSQIEIAGIGIATGESFVGHRIRVIHATIKNNSGEHVRLVDVKMVFRDIEGKSIHESVETVFQAAQKPLEPGSSYRFEVNFENLPRTWNYHIPDIEMVRLAH